ncbi:angiotensin-converting enzyme-like [Apostichopus japonicus]|uniref:angiotensin-converting enzyme-like n=1 Tax=Stichopus japonicus TaxID=307972 RepID=UPI003AB26A39
MEMKYITIYKVFLIGILCFFCSMDSAYGQGDEEEAKAFLQDYNRRAENKLPGWIEASWDYYADLTEDNQVKQIQAQLDRAAFELEAHENASYFDREDFSYDTKRQLEKLVYIGESALDDESKLTDLKDVKASLKSRYSTSKVCLETTGECLNIDPGLENFMKTNRDYFELYKVWSDWRDVAAAPARNDYREYVQLSNLVAEANDQPDKGAYWRSWYESEDLVNQLEAFYEGLYPFYSNLHAYVRRKLYNVYGSKYINLNGPIPAHVLGSMAGHSWHNLYDLFVPFPDKPEIEATDGLQKLDYTPRRMYLAAQAFFTSLGLEPLNDEFWSDSIFEEPSDGTEMSCTAGVWDFMNAEDFRIKSCIDVNHDDFMLAHYLMGRMNYAFNYKEQPVVYRDGANPAFQAAVGDAISLSVRTPRHLYYMGLLEEVSMDDETNLNYLMKLALEKIVLLPYALTLENWRWSVFNSSTTNNEYNQVWWELRKRYQGVVPPVERTEADFDPAAKYHVIADIPFLRYLFGNVLQFQFHQALCELSLQPPPLYECDIFGSRDAGDALIEMMKLGSSRSWQEAMQAITGRQFVDVQPIVDYFEPLQDWLEATNQANGDSPGWDIDWMPEAPSSYPTLMSSVLMLVFSVLFSLLFSTH